MQRVHALRAYFRTGIFEKSRLNHFFWSFAIVPFFARALHRSVLTGASSFEPFWSTAPYCSCVTTWPATGPYAPGCCLLLRALTSGTSRIIAWQRLIWTAWYAAVVVG